VVRERISILFRRGAGSALAA